MSRSQTFAHSPASVRLAREFARDALRGSSPDVVETVTLMVSELATNCIRHADGPFDLRVIRGPGEIRIEATDHGPEEPRVRHPLPTDPTGRGLQIVALLSSDWGCRRRAGSGKTVWFTVADTAAG
jgi:anti-sigma regulatory factor (Ser/Thr protein kinase)